MFNKEELLEEIEEMIAKRVEDSEAQIYNSIEDLNENIKDIIQDQLEETEEAIGENIEETKQQIMEEIKQNETKHEEGFNEFKKQYEDELKKTRKVQDDLNKADKFNCKIYINHFLIDEKLLELKNTVSNNLDKAKKEIKNTAEDLNDSMKKIKKQVKGDADMMTRKLDKITEISETLDKRHKRERSDTELYLGSTEKKLENIWTKISDISKYNVRIGNIVIRVIESLKLSSLWNVHEEEKFIESLGGSGYNMGSTKYTSPKNILGIESIDILNSSVNGSKNFPSINSISQSTRHK